MMHRLFTFAIVAALCGIAIPVSASANGRAQGGECSAANDYYLETLAHNYVDTLNLHDTSLYPSLFSDDLVLDSTYGMFEGLDQYTALMSQVIAAFPDIHWQIDELMVRGNRIMIRYSFTATHTGDFLGIPASGAQIYVTGMEVHDVVNGKIVHSRNFSDAYGLFAQVGAL